MDAVAAEAGVTKPTLYLFPSKESLFQAMMLGKRDLMLDVFEHPLPQGMVADLVAFAWAYADTVMRPEMLSLARLIIGEVQRFPEIGRAYQASGPDHLLRGIMRYLDGQRARGRLEFDDAELAAQDLWGLILSAPRTQALYMPDASPTAPRWPAISATACGCSSRPIRPRRTPTLPNSTRCKAPPATGDP
jgi:TetR/AcrR family transcriptional repressor of mexJK operon